MTTLLDPTHRLRTILRAVLPGCSYVDSYREGDRAIILIARRPDGSRVRLRFLGVQKSESSDTLPTGAALRLVGVGDRGLWTLLLPAFLRGPSRSARVRIDAGPARLDIVCEDVEWWADTPEAPGG